MISEWSVQQQVIGFGIGRHQRILDFAALPGLEHRKLVKDGFLLEQDVDPVVAHSAVEWAYLQK